MLVRPEGFFLKKMTDLMDSFRICWKSSGFVRGRSPPLCWSFCRWWRKSVLPSLQRTRWNNIEVIYFNICFLCRPYFLYRGPCFFPGPDADASTSKAHRVPARIAVDSAWCFIYLKFKRIFALRIFWSWFFYQTKHDCPCSVPQSLIPSPKAHSAGVCHSKKREHGWNDV